MRRRSWCISGQVLILVQQDQPVKFKIKSGRIFAGVPRLGICQRGVGALTNPRVSPHDSLMKLGLCPIGASRFIGNGLTFGVQKNLDMSVCGMSLEEQLL